MNKLSILSAGILLAAMGCDSQPESTAASKSQPKAKTEKVKDSLTNKNYASRPTVNTWPQTDTENIDLADNLSATNYYLVLDGSGSMTNSRCSGGKSKMHAAKSAVSTFIQQIPQDANIGLLAFDSKGTSERVTLGSNNRPQMLNAVKNVRANGGTPLRSAISRGYASLEAQAKKQLGYGEYHLVVITDGEANSSQNPSRIVDRILEDSPVLIHTIGFCIEGGHSLNQAGRIDYKQANDPESLRKGLQEVLAEAPAFQQDQFDG